MEMVLMGKFMDSIKKLWKFEYRVPEELVNINETMLIHISDTPSEIYHDIINTIKRLEPDYLIHTGDIADEVKIGEESEQSIHYEKLVEPFLKQLTELVPNIYISLGNHDCLRTIKRVINSNQLSLEIISSSDEVFIEDKSFVCSHYLEDVLEAKIKSNFYLYGHNYDFPVDTDEEKQGVFLNGVKAINIILINSNRIYHLPYPKGTDYHRKYSRPMKLL